MDHAVTRDHSHWDQYSGSYYGLIKQSNLMNYQISAELFSS